VNVEEQFGAITNEKYVSKLHLSAADIKYFPFYNDIVEFFVLANVQYQK